MWTNMSMVLVLFAILVTFEVDDHEPFRLLHNEGASKDHTRIFLYLWAKLAEVAGKKRC